MNEFLFFYINNFAYSPNPNISLFNFKYIYKRIG